MHKIILGLLLLVVAAAPASARGHRHHYQRYHTIVSHAVDPGCNIIFPCEGVSASPRGQRVAKAMGGFGVAKQVYTPSPEAHWGLGSSSGTGKPSRYIAGRLICAINVNSALAERGIKGTGSALAMSFRNWGHSAGGPVPGAVVLSARRGGGHVALVSRVDEKGVVYVWNATGGQSGWREIPHRHRVIDYRVPG